MVGLNLTRLTDAYFNLGGLEYATNLEYLRLSNNGSGYGVTAAPFEAGVRAGREADGPLGLRNLRFLDLSGTVVVRSATSGVTGDTVYPFAALRTLGKLEYLNLDGLEIITAPVPSAADAFAAMPNLTWLSLENARQYDVSVSQHTAFPAFTAPQPKLKYLALNGSPIVADYRALGRSDSLIEVELRNSVPITSALVFSTTTAVVGANADPLAGAVVLDNRSDKNPLLGSYTETGPWTGGDSAGAFEGDYRILPYVPDSGPAGSATFTLALNQTYSVPTEYDVYATWPAGTYHTARAQFEIRVDGVLVATVYAGQTLDPLADITLGDRPWQRLTTIALPAGLVGHVSVTLTNAGAGSLVADGIQLIRQMASGGPPLPNLKLVDLRGNATLGNEFYDYAAGALEAKLGSANTLGDGTGVWYAANPAPVMPAFGPVTDFGGAVVSVPLSSTDTVGNPVTYTLDSYDAGLFNTLSTNVSGNTLFLSPKAGASGNTQVTLRATDGGRVTLQTIDVRLGVSSTNTVTAGNGDVRVNTTVVGSQTYPDVAVAADGRSVVVWQQYTAANNSWNSYFQRYDKYGTKLGGETLVGSLSAANVDQSQPDVSFAADGSFVVVWHSNANAGQSYDVYARRFNADGTPQIDPILVTDASTVRTRTQYFAQVGSDASGRFVVTWFDIFSGADLDVYVRQYAADGTPLSGPLTVAFSGSEESYPDVAVDPLGNYAVAYNGPDANGLGVFTRRGSIGSSILTAAELVSSNNETGTQSAPQVAYNSLGESVIVWVDGPSNSNLYGRRYDAFGNAGPVFVVDTSGGTQTFPVAALDDDGTVTVAYQSNWLGSNDVLARRFGKSGWSTPAFTLVSQSNSTSQAFAGVASRPGGSEFTVVWASNNQDAADGGDGVYMRQYHFDGLLRQQDSEQLVNTNEQTGTQLYPVVAASPNGRTFTVWQSNRAVAGASVNEVFLQPMSAAGAPVGSPVLVAATSHASPTPVVAAIDDRLVVVWVDSGGIGLDLYARRYSVNPDGTVSESSSTELVNANSTAGNQSTPAVAMDVTGRYAVAWSVDAYSSTATIWLGRFAANGMQLEPEFTLATAGPFYDHFQTPAIGMDGTGAVVAAWSAYSNEDGNTSGVYVRRVPGGPLGTIPPAVRTNSVSDSGQRDPAVGMLPDGRAVIAWINEQGAWLVSRVLAADGTFAGSPAEQAVAIYAPPTQQRPSVAVDTAGRYAIAWDSAGQNAGQTGVFVRRFAADGTPIGPELPLASSAGVYQFAARVAYSGNTLVGVWTSYNQDAPGTFGIYTRRLLPDATVRAFKEDPTHAAVAGVTGFLDANGSETWDAGEPISVSGPDGWMTFTDAPGGGYVSQEVVPPGSEQLDTPTAFAIDDGSLSATVGFTNEVLVSLADQYANEGDTLTHTPVINLPGYDVTFAWAVFRLPDTTTPILTGSGPTLSWTVPDDGIFVIQLIVTAENGDGTKTITVNGHAYARNVAAAPTLPAAETLVVDEGTNLTVDAGASDVPADLTTMHYEWTITHGTDAPLSVIGDGPDYATLSRLFPNEDAVPTVITVRFRDTGDPAVWQTRTVSVTAVDVAATPTLHLLGPAPRYEGDIYAFEGSYTDPNPLDPHGESWQILNVFGGVVAQGTGNRFTFVPRDDGRYTARYLVGDAPAAEVAFDVENAAPVLTAVIDPPVLTEEQSGGWAASFGDAGMDDAHSADWQVRDAANTVVASGNGPAAAGTPFAFSWTPAFSGTYSVLVTVNDDDGGTVSTANLPVLVQNVKPRGVAASNDGPGLEEGTITLTGTYRDPDTDATFAAHWVVTDSTGTIVAVLNGLTAAFTPPDNGLYAATLTVTNIGTQLSSTATTTVVVENRPPTGVFVPPAYLPANEPYTFNVTGLTDPSSADAAAGLHVAFDWNGDGVFEVGDGTYAGSPTSSSASVGLPAGQRTVTARVLDKDGGFTDYTRTIAAAARPTVASVAVNGGQANTAQRSRVTNLTVTFAGLVDLQAGAFTLTRQSDGASITDGGTAGPRIFVNTAVVNGVTVAVLTFTGTGLVEFGSLADGVWVLRVNAGKVAAAGTAVSMAADFVTPSTGNAAAGRIHRLFGDLDGDRDVDALDNLRFRQAFGAILGQLGPAYQAAFDFDGDGDIDALDNLRFRQRFGVILP